MAEAETRVVVAPKIRTEDLPDLNAEIPCGACEVLGMDLGPAVWAGHSTCCGTTVTSCECHRAQVDDASFGYIVHETGCGRVGWIDRWWRL